MKWNIEEQPILFPYKVRKIYEIIYKKNRFKYSNWIGDITASNHNNIDWWMTKPTLRNPYKSNLLNYITVIETLEKIKEKDLEIITFSSQMKLVLSKYFSKKFNLKIYVNKNNNDFLNNISSLVKTFVFQFFIFYILKFLLKKIIIRTVNLHLLIHL